MSQFDLTQLSKKNQEFVRIAKHQLIENGKTEEEATSLIEEILPTIFENQPKRSDCANSIWRSYRLGQCL